MWQGRLGLAKGLSVWVFECCPPARSRSEPTPKHLCYSATLLLCVKVLGIGTGNTFTLATFLGHRHRDHKDAMRALWLEMTRSETGN